MVYCTTLGFFFVVVVLNRQRTRRIEETPDDSSLNSVNNPLGRRVLAVAVTVSSPCYEINNNKKTHCRSPKLYLA